MIESANAVHRETARLNGQGIRRILTPLALCVTVETHSTMGSPHDELNAKQQAALRWLHEHRNDGNRLHERTSVIAETDLSDGEYVGLLKYLDCGDHLHEIVRSDGGPYAVAFILKDTISAEVKQLDNPPPRDFPKEVKQWFFSKWWSLPFWIIIVILPALVGYVTMIKALIEWFGLNK